MSKFSIVGTVVRVCVQDSRGILFVQSSRLQEKCQWELPGGKVEESETLFEAARRELREETSLHLLQARKVIDWRRKTPFGAHWRYVIFSARKVVSTAKISEPEEILDISFFLPRSLPPLDEHTRSLFRKFRKQLR